MGGLTVHLLQIGEIEEELLISAVSHLEGVFKNCRFVKSQGDKTLLQCAYNGRRRQYDSRIILERLSKALEALAAVDKLLTLVDVDLYTAGLNFVFGQAQCLGRFAVVSTYRLRPEFYGAGDGAVFVSRVKKEMVHELGHTFGVQHCGDPRCVMFFSNNILDTDRKGDRFCGRCLREYGAF